MEQDLIKLVKANLPEMAAKEFSKYFDLSERTKELLEDTKQDLENFRRTNDQLGANNQKLSAENEQLKSENGMWKGRQADVEDRERKLEIMKLEGELSCEKRVTETYKDVMGRVFSNTIVRENINKNIGIKNDPFYNGSNPDGSVRYCEAGERVENHTDVVVKTTE